MQSPERRVNASVPSIPNEDLMRAAIGRAANRNVPTVFRRLS